MKIFTRYVNSFKPVISRGLMKCILKEFQKYFMHELKSDRDQAVMGLL